MIDTLSDYKRPPPSTSIYPYNVTKVITIQEHVASMYEDPTQFKGTVHAGGLKHEYGMVNKILHYNLFLKGAEKTPNVEKLSLLNAVMMGKNIDIALFIWEVMKDFAKADHPRANLPFGNLVTRMCDHFKPKGYASDKITPSKTGAIGQASSSKRSAMTRAERARPSEPGSSSAGPSSEDPSGSRPFTAMPESLIAHRLDTLEETVYEISAMMTRLYQQAFPGNPIPTRPPSQAAGPSAPSASTVVEMGESKEEEDDDEGSGEADGEEGSDDDDGGDEA